MKNSGGKMKKVYKLKKRNCLISSLLVFGVFLITLGGLFTVKSSLIDLLNYKASGDVPAHSKSIGDNHDGTWKLALDVTGDSEKKPQHVNVIVIVDRSGSMGHNTDTTTTTYTPTSGNGNNLYGYVDGEYVPLDRRYDYVPYDGTPTNNGTTYYGRYNNRYVNLYYNNGTWYRTRNGYGWTGYSYSNPYTGTFYTYDRYYFLEDGTVYTGQRYDRQVVSTRMEATKSAVNSLASSLLQNNEVEGNDDDTVEMALVTFATNAATNNFTENNVTTHYTASEENFTNAVNGITVATNGSAGTNWEAALKAANGISFDDEDPTYVIFFSDGSPTFRDTRDGHDDRAYWYGTDLGVYGSGQEEEPNMQWAYDNAKDNAATLATKVGVKNFYTIFAYGSDEGKEYMEDLTAAAGSPATNNYTAALQQAFADILAKIEMSGVNNVKIEDGTTEAVKIESTDTNGMLVVDSSSFKYTVTVPITGGKATIRGQEATLTGNTLTWGDNKSVTGTIDNDGKNFVYEWTGENDLTEVAPPAAKDEGGKVTWDLSSAGVLINGATYRVTFDVWPSQETYDLIADLKNKEI